ncbi:hypothetical protein FQN57_000218 [Myotisia sp. PD_48]|nr:hypothetical protein FQN57_000218 [Myotisia sp. PD_48]
MINPADSPPSDSDPYFNSGSNSSSPFAKYPTQVTLPELGLGGRLLLWSQQAWEDALTASITKQLDLIQCTLNRPATQDETDAFVSLSSSRLRYDRAGVLSGVGLAAALARGAFSSSPIWSSLIPAPLAADPKRKLIMLGVAFPFCIFIGTTAGQGAAIAHTAVMISSSPKFAQYRKEIGELDVNQLQQRQKQFVAQQMAAARATAARTANKTQQPSEGQSSAYFSSNDASPSKDYYQDYSGSQSGYSNGQSSSDSKILTEAYSAQRDDRGASFSSSSSNYRPGENQQSGAGSNRPSDTSPTSSAGQSFWDDDASPVNPQVEPASASQPSPPVGSSWARIRRQSLGQSTPGYDDSTGQDEQSGRDSWGSRSRLQNPDAESSNRGGDYDRYSGTGSDNTGSGSGWGRRRSS